MAQTKTKLWYLENFNLFKELDMKKVQELSHNSTMSHSRKNQVIFFPETNSDTIYFLKEGKVKISRLSDEGESVTIQVVGAGEIFGESALMGQDKHENMAETMEPAVICAINKAEFMDFLDRNPKLNRAVNQLIGFRIRKIEAHIEDLVFRDSRERILLFLERYVESFGRFLTDLWEVRPFLTHQQIGEITATSRQTVNQVLNDLKREGIIDFTRRHLWVKDRDRLKKLLPR
ncbi:MAG: Crp/Fnr family transcriptional regulator [Candidatus Marinimicrobia bacterium]|nr:Crp/Fnr family transcriptional regulator [Candidatus Neomarinimicrobiota bacterium]MCF7902795.1 Crp/Fnr family transcriptional regulator [Candidatus Neomarinimicrobiota bacterium]